MVDHWAFQPVEAHCHSVKRLFHFLETSAIPEHGIALTHPPQKRALAASLYHPSIPSFFPPLIPQHHYLTISHPHLLPHPPLHLPIPHNLHLPPPPRSQVGNTPKLDAHRLALLQYVGCDGSDLLERECIDYRRVDGVDFDGAVAALVVEAEGRGEEAFVERGRDEWDL